MDKEKQDNIARVIKAARRAMTAPAQAKDDEPYIIFDPYEAPTLPELGQSQPVIPQNLNAAAGGITDMYRGAKAIRDYELSGSLGQANYSLSRGGLTVTGPLEKGMIKANVNRHGDLSIDMNKRALGGEISASAGSTDGNKSFRLQYQKGF